MSATCDATLFAKFFERISEGESTSLSKESVSIEKSIIKVPIMDIQLSSYVVDEFYLDNIVKPKDVSLILNVILFLKIIIEYVNNA